MSRILLDTSSSLLYSTGERLYLFIVEGCGSSRLGKGLVLYNYKWVVRKVGFEVLLIRWELVLLIYA